MGIHSTYYVQRDKILSLWSFWRPFGVTQSDNGASKKSIGNEPKIHLSGVIPNKLKHGGLGHRPSPLEREVVVSSCVFLLFALLVTPRLLLLFG